MKSRTRSESLRKPKSRIEFDLTGRHTALVDIIRDGFAQFAPPPDLTVSEWADEYRILSREDSSEPGRWRTSRFEPQRGIMDSFTELGVRDVVVKKGSQVGWTAMLGNVFGYFIDLDPCPMLLMQPTVKMAEAWSKDRLSPMLRDTKRLHGKIKDARSRDSGNTILHKQFMGGHLTMIGSNAPADMASRPLRIVGLDEIDRHAENAGKEGSPDRIIKQRQRTFWNAITLKGSTPKFKGGPIEKAYEQSDKRMFFAQCQHCAKKAPANGYQTLRFEQIKFDRDDEKLLIRETVHYQCEHCGELWDDADRDAAVAKGEWRSTTPFRGIAGFFISQIYSPWTPLVDIVEEFLYSKDNPEDLQVFVNTVLGEGWEEQGEKVDSEGLIARAEPYGPDDLPDGVLVATIGVDTQDDRLEAQIIGWGEGDEAWPIKFEILTGDPAEQEVWDDLDLLTRQTFMTRSGRVVRIRAGCVDSGGHHTDQVHRFCRGKLSRKIFAIQGQGGARPIWPMRATKSRKTKSPLRMIGVDTAKDRIYARLRIKPPEKDEPKPGYIHFPLQDDPTKDAGFGAEYYKQLTIEEVRTKFINGRAKRYWWTPKGARNEAFDTFVYALAARHALSDHLKRYAETAQAISRKASPGGQKKTNVPVETPSPEIIKAPRRQRGGSWIGRQRGGWMRK